MAYARIGVNHVNQYQVEAAKEWFEKAYALRDRVSERERFYLTEKYYNYVTGEIDKAIETLQTWARLYPDDFIPHNNLSLNYKFFGRYEDSLKEAIEAVRLSPNSTSAWENLIASFVALGRFDEAEQAARDGQKINPDSLSVHFSNYLFAFLRRDQAAMDRELQWAKGRPDEALFITQQAGAAVYFGKLKRSEELHNRAVEMFESQNRNENASSELLFLATEFLLMGKCQQAKDSAKASLALFRGVGSANAAIIYGACGDAGEAESLLDEARSIQPKNTIMSSIYVPMVRAAIEKSRGNAAEAIKSLESMRSFDGGRVTGLGTTYMRGNLYLQQRMGNEAAAEFKKIIESPGIDISSPVHALAHLGLGRAAAVNGDTAGARKAYQDFFALWKDVDQDLPVLIQARKEYEQLK
jgi:tetratricopeptide (TPR) repeat protein